MKKIKRVPVFKLRVVYQSGYTHDFEVTKFSYSGGTYEWKAVSQKNKPLLFGADEVAAVYQIGLRHVWRLV